MINTQLKAICSFILSFVFIFIIAVPVYSLATDKATSAGVTKTGGGIENPLGKSNNNLATFLQKILRVVFELGAIVVVFFIVFSGFKYVMAQGNPAEISKVHTMLLWTAVGAAVLLGAQTIADVIQNTVTQLAK